MAAADAQELGPCLIAPTSTFNPIWDVGNFAKYSLDMLRFKVTYPDFGALVSILDTWDGLDHIDTYQTNKIGAYRLMWVWDAASVSQGENGYRWGASDVKLVAGFGLNRPNGKTDNVGFIEFNPNKCSEIGLDLILHMLGNGAEISLLRYDIAIDYPIQRDKIRLIKDKRKYGCEISNGMTEYLGQRNHAGRVKVYDKQAESRLPYPCTRVEITCDACWDSDKIREQLPVLYDYTTDKLTNFGGVIKPFIIALNELFKHGEIIETWLRLVDPKTRTKIRKFIKGETDITVIYSDDALKRIVERAHKYEGGML